jgi:hypothetical protein
MSQTKEVKATEKAEVVELWDISHSIQKLLDRACAIKFVLESGDYVFDGEDGEIPDGVYELYIAVCELSCLQEAGLEALKDSFREYIRQNNEKI